MKNLKVVTFVKLFLWSISTPVFLLLTCTMAFYRVLLGVYLHLRHGDSFGGFLVGQDAIFAADEPINRQIINGVMILRADNPLEVRASILRVIQEKHLLENHPKLRSIKCRAGGYAFLLKRSIPIESLIRIVDLDVDLPDDDFLQRFLATNANNPMPADDGALWEFLIISKPVTWGTTRERCVFAILRAHHSLGDGFSLLKFIFAYVLNDKSEKHIELMGLENSVETGSKAGSLFKYVYKLIQNLFIIVLSPVIVLFNLIENEKEDMGAGEEKLLKGKQLTGDKVIVWAVEENQKLVNYVKAIKNNVTGTRFSEVVMAAISASMNTYYEKKFQQKIPNYIANSMPLLDRAAVNIRPPGLFNDMLLTFTRLPISINNKTNNWSWLDRLEKVKEQAAIARKSPLIVINYLFSKLLIDKYPIFVQRCLLEIGLHGIVITILPGLDKKIRTLYGVVEDLFFMTPIPGCIGIGFSVLTYDNRFQISLIADNAVISDQEEARTIVNDVFRNISHFYYNK